METDIQKNESSRIDWIDAAKGLAIILVIIGHSLSHDQLGTTIKGCIYSFHMPLFFILSALTFKLSADSGQFLSKTEKAFRHLVVPVLLTYALKYRITVVMANHLDWTAFLARRFNSLTFASCSPVYIQKAKIFGIGFLWFLVALFVGRTLFDYLHLKLKDDKKLIIATAVCTILGLAAVKIQALPLALDIALACMPFFYFGYYLKSCKISENNRKIAIYSLLIWIIGIIISNFWTDQDKYFYLDVAQRIYPLVPLCYIIAAAGTLLISCGSIFLTDRFSKLSKPLIYIGKYSLYLLCIHYLDVLFKSIWNSTGTSIGDCLIRLALDLLLLAAFVKLAELIKHRFGKEAAPEVQARQPGQQSGRSKVKLKK